MAVHVHREEVVMEILLGPMEIEKERWAAANAWEKLGKIRKLRGDPDEQQAAWRAFCDAWLCRAQVKRVVEWANDENMNKDADWEASRTDARLKYAEVQMDKGDLWIDFVSYQALRKAGGGE